MMLGTGRLVRLPGHTHAKSAFIYATVLEGRSAVRSMTDR